MYYPTGRANGPIKRAILVEVNNSCTDHTAHSEGHILFMCLSDIANSQWFKHAMDHMVLGGLDGRIMSPGGAMPAGLDIKRRYLFDDNEWGLYPPEVQSLVTVRYQLARRFSTSGFSMAVDLDGAYRQIKMEESEK
jgi:hypothetical protein